MTILKNLPSINILKKWKKTLFSPSFVSKNQTIKQWGKLQHIDRRENKEFKGLLFMKFKSNSAWPFFPLVRFSSSFLGKKKREQNSKPFKARQRILANAYRPQEKSPDNFIWVFLAKKRQNSLHLSRIYKRSLSINLHRLSFSRKRILVRSKKGMPIPSRRGASPRKAHINLYKDFATLAESNAMTSHNKYKYGYRVKVKTISRLAYAYARRARLQGGGLLSSKGEAIKKIKPFVIRKNSTQLFTIGKKRLVTCKQVLLAKKVEYKKYKKKRRKPKQRTPIIIPRGAKIGKISIKGSYNNIILTLTGQEGNTKAWASAGTAGFKNGRKSSHFAAESAADRLVDRCSALGYTIARVNMKGLGSGKLKAMRRLCKSNLRLLGMSDNFSIPYNGCRRARKPRK